MKSFWIALSTLTFFPVRVPRWTVADLRGSLVFYPAVGLLLGLLVSLNRFWPAPVSIRALLALLTGVVLTRGFHLDGLADCLDGWLGATTPAARYRIMKDPSIGVYGALGLSLILLSKFVFLELLLPQPESWKWLILIFALARWCVVLACLLHPSHSRYKGLAAPLFGLTGRQFFLASLFLIPGFLWFPVFFGFALALAAGFSYFGVYLSRRMIGAITGDGLGALVECVETGLLLFAASRSF